LVLCFLEGRTQDEAAKQLGWSERTLRRRLEEARAAPGRRLTRHGVAWSAALSALLLSNCVAPPALPSALVGSTAEAACLIAAGQMATTGLVSVKVVTLTDGVMKAMFISAERSPAELEADWKDLGGDAAVGYAALGRLISSPKSAVPFLGKQLQRPVDAKPIERLIGNLDDKDFQVRERATTELEAMGYRAAPSLRKALGVSPSAKVRQRLDRLLQRLDGAGPLAETVPDVRAVEALEAIGTLEARQVLEKLAPGPSGMRLTEEAKAPADRLAKRSSTRPQ
jgi:Sigma-70, region 4